MVQEVTSKKTRRDGQLAHKAPIESARSYAAVASRAVVPVSHAKLQHPGQMPAHGYDLQREQ